MIFLFSYIFLYYKLILIFIFFTFNSIGATVKPFGKSINSKYNEILPVFSRDGKILYFCREGHPQNAGYSKNKNDQDIWFSIYKKEKWNKAKAIRSVLNNAGSNFPVGVSKDNKTLYVGNIYSPENKSFEQGISFSTKRKKKWSSIQSLKIKDFYNNARSANYFMTYNESIMLLNLKRKDSYGGMDIYISFKGPDGEWSAPFNLGKNINSNANEITPFIGKDLDKIYFASNRPKGLGGYDIYVSIRLDPTWTKWSKPVNLGNSINTSGNDISFVLHPIESYAVMASDQLAGNFNLYKVKLLSTNSMKIRLFKVTGAIQDQNNKPIQAKVSYELNHDRGGFMIDTIQTDWKGKFQFSVPFDGEYSLKVFKKGYIADPILIDPRKNLKTKSKKYVIRIHEMKQGKIIHLKNVDYDASELSTGSYKELYRIIHLLKKNPSLRVEIGGHVYDLGNISYNMQVSKSGANTVRNFFIQKGIPKERIPIKAYGASKPIISSKSKKNKKLNKRIELKILSVKDKIKN